MQSLVDRQEQGNLHMALGRVGQQPQKRHFNQRAKTSFAQPIGEVMAPIDVLKQISDVIWEIPVSYKDGLRVPARIYGTEKLIRDLDDAV